MDYAVLRIKGHQYKVSEGQEILVDKINLADSVGKVGDAKLEADILLVSKEDKVKVGKPLVKDAKVTIKVLGEEKGEKIDVYKYKSKSRYRRHTGFRSQLTRLLIQKIS
ncbi:MAG: 50S ribosomal protein L21 [Candidatus Woesebacteria bacterium]|nr:50S ribosomal protein L21 [Candidatus Woesebacteria bacterium]